MSIKAINWAFEQTALPRNLALTLLALCSCANNNISPNKANPSLKHLASKAFCSPRQVRYDLEELERLGLIVRDGSTGKTGQITVWRWALDVDQIEAIRPPAERRRKGHAMQEQRRQPIATLKADAGDRLIDDERGQPIASLPRQPIATLNDSKGGNPLPGTVATHCHRNKVVNKNKRESSLAVAKEKVKKNRPKDLVEVVQYFQSQGASGAEAESWFNRNESIGWKTGRARNDIKDWKASARYWIGNINKYDNGKTTTTTLDVIKSEMRKLHQ